MMHFIDRHIKWVFSLPALCFMGLMVAAPLLMTLAFSFTEWSLLLGESPAFNWGANYLAELSQAPFWDALRITFVYTLLATVLELLLGLSIAVIVNRDFVGKNIAKTILLLPYMMAPVAVGLMWVLFYEPSSGLVGYLFRVLGLPPLAFTSARETVIPSIAAVEVWQMTPMVVIVCLAGLSVLPTDPVEAAHVDGASKPQVFFRITLPMLSSTLFSIGLLRFIDVFKSFDLIYAMSKGGPANASRTLSLYAFETAFTYFRFGKASAILIMLFVIVLLISLVVIKLQHKWGGHLE